MLTVSVEVGECIATTQWLVNIVIFRNHHVDVIFQPVIVYSGLWSGIRERRKLLSVLIYRAAAVVTRPPLLSISASLLFISLRKRSMSSEAFLAADFTGCEGCVKVTWPELCMGHSFSSCLRSRSPNHGFDLQQREHFMQTLLTG